MHLFAKHSYREGEGEKESKGEQEGMQIFYSASLPKLGATTEAES